MLKTNFVDKFPFSLIYLHFPIILKDTENFLFLPLKSTYKVQFTIINHLQSQKLQKKRIVVLLYFVLVNTNQYLSDKLLEFKILKKKKFIVKYI